MNKKQTNKSWHEKRKNSRVSLKWVGKILKWARVSRCRPHLLPRKKASQPGKKYPPPGKEDALSNSVPLQKDVRKSEWAVD